MKNYEFSKYLYELRKLNRITQRQLAHHLGLSDKTVSKWESGNGMPKSEDLLCIANFFGITVDRLLACGNNPLNREHTDFALSPLEISDGNHQEEINELPVNLIPETSKPTGNYMCTWSIQREVAKKLGIAGNKNSHLRDALDQSTLFGKENYYHPISRKLRNGLIFLLDDGWDVPYATPNDAQHKKIFGSCNPDNERFSKFGNTPVERLKTISEKLKEMGYAGLGLWISPQQSGETEFDFDTARSYWEERAKWCNDAGVLYWKVDWGFHTDDEYRRMMSECARKFAPELIVEHAVLQMPFTVVDEDGAAERRKTRVKTQMAFSDVYRTYDVVRPLDNVCTLQRASEALTANVERELNGLGLINAESQALIAASLGLTVGVMEFDKNMQACLNWHRIAPPFGIHGNNCICSEELLEDSMFFENDVVTWFKCAGETIFESAPAIIARNCPLPVVKKRFEHSPFVTASKNPLTEAYSVAIIPRAIDPNPYVHCLADVTIKDVDVSSPVGIFGVFNSLTIEFTKQLPEKIYILVQDLTHDKAIDVTHQVIINSSSITLDGKKLRFWSKYSRGINDNSEPSLVLTIRENDKNLI